jgi:YHS domain-containing protein
MKARATRDDDIHSVERRSIMAHTPIPSKEAVDPVCGMTVESASAPLAFDARRRVYYFCSSACREEFQKNPERYAAKKKGFWSRYLDRVKKVTDGKPMSCCH